MKGKRRALGLTAAAAVLVPLLLVFLCTVSIGAEKGTLVYKAKHRTVEELAGMIHPLLGPDGKLSIDPRTNSLIVADAKENLGRIEKFLETADLAPASVRVSMEYAEKGRLEARGLTVNWVAGEGGFRFGNLGALPADWDRGIRITGKHKTYTTSRADRFFLLVQSGSEGRIDLGKTVPHAKWLVDYSRSQGYLTVGVDFVEANTGFVVSPRVTGECILLSITPRVSYFTEGTVSEIVYREAATTLMVGDGETVAVAGSEGESATLSTSILSGIESSRVSGDWLMLLTCRIERP